MSNCPRCHQLVDSQAIACPHCKYQLKAFGHPGIPLYRSTGEEYLCSSCLYHEDDTCNFPQRPLAKECTLYHNRSEPLVPPSLQTQQKFSTRITSWVQQNIIWFVVLSLLVISFVVSLL